MKRSPLRHDPYCLREWACRNEDTRSPKTRRYIHPLTFVQRPHNSASGGGHVESCGISANSPPDAMHSEARRTGVKWRAHPCSRNWPSLQANERDLLPESFWPSQRCIRLESEEALNFRSAVLNTQDICIGRGYEISDNIFTEDDFKTTWMTSTRVFDPKIRANWENVTTRHSVPRFRGEKIPA